MTTAKQPVNPNWFNQLEGSDYQKAYSWLLTLGIQAETIADFGCWIGIEPFALLWTLNASEIAVVEINKEHLQRFKGRIENIQQGNPECLEGRTIKPILADMCLPVAELQSNYFDLAFCDNVLYNMKIDQPDFAKVQSAINEMARVVRPGGCVVVYEPKMGVKYEEKNVPLGNGSFFPTHEPLNDPVDISGCFTRAGLVRADLEIPPGQCLYVYLKVIIPSLHVYRDNC